MFSKQTFLVIFLYVLASSGASAVVSDCKKHPNNICTCDKGFTNLGDKCLSLWLVVGIFSGVVVLLIIVIIILGCRLAKANKAYKQPEPVADSIFREDRSTSTSSMPRNQTKDASTDTESREALTRTPLAKVPMFGAPFSYTNSSFESNEKSYVPDFMKRKNYDQSTFEEIPLHDGRRLDRSSGDDSNIIFSIKRPVHSYYSKASDKSF